jgi:unsaturated rhamnogalacturonyl hydrolase
MTAVESPPSVAASRGLARPLAERIRSAAHAALAYWYYRWDWGEAIAFDGLFDAASALSWPAGLELVDAELRRWMAEGPPTRHGPCNLLLSRSREVGAEQARALLVAIADGIGASPRSARGALLLDGTGRAYVDSLYGDPLFLWRLGTELDRSDLRALAVELACGHVASLQDRRSGLMCHYDSAEPRIHWGRGNGWAALGLSDLLRAVPRDVDGRDQLADSYRRLVESLVAHQTPGGEWRNVIDDTASFPEASTTALVETAIGQSVRAGDLSASYSSVADAAWAGIEHRIDANGHLAGVSFRPGINTDPARYEHVPVVGVYPWGNGAYLRAAARRLHEAA